MNAALRSYVRVLRSRWRWLLWGTLISLAATTIALALAPCPYVSHATVFVRTPGDVSRVVDGGDSYARARATSYAALASSPSVSNGVIADLGLDEPADALADRIKADNPPGTALINISVDAPSAGEVQQIATAFLYEYGAKVRQLESVPGSLVPRAELVVVDPPGQGHREVAGGLPVPFILLGMTMIGLVLGATAAVLRFRLQTRDPTPLSDDSDPASELQQEVTS